MKHLTLKAAREKAGLTQYELQERSGVERSRISRLETDPDANPTLNTIRNLEEALGVRPGTLIFGEEACEVSR